LDKEGAPANGERRQNGLNLQRQILAIAVTLTVLALGSSSLSAQSCQISSDLDEATQSAIATAGQRYFDMASKGDAAALRRNANASLLADFSGIEAAVKDNQQELAEAKATVKSVFLLTAEGTTPLPRAEFYCGVFGGNGQTPGSAVFYLSNLPPGKYAVVVLEASSPKAKTNFSVILQQSGPDWKLAGLYLKPAQVSGHDSAWFAARAREYKGKGQAHNAWWFYQEASSLASPVTFMSTMATDRLYDEFQTSQPADLPGGGKSADLVVGNITYKLIAIFPEAVGDDLDLIVKYESADAANSNLAYPANVAVIKALVTKYPEVREAFAGVVARAQDNSGHDYGTLLAMKDIK